MDLQAYLKTLRRGSKKDDLPGTVDVYLDELCPECGHKQRIYKPCCGSPMGYKGCPCGYRTDRVTRKVLTHTGGHDG
jgi:hypothetical protein